MNFNILKIFNPVNLLVVANKAFGYTHDYTLSMPFWLLMAMLIDYNVMNEFTPSSKSGKKIKRIGAKDLAKNLGGK